MNLLEALKALEPLAAFFDQLILIPERDRVEVSSTDNDKIVVVPRGSSYLKEPIQDLNAPCLLLLKTLTGFNLNNIQHCAYLPKTRNRGAGIRIGLDEATAIVPAASYGVEDMRCASFKGAEFNCSFIVHDNAVDAVRTWFNYASEEHRHEPYINLRTVNGILKGHFGSGRDRIDFNIQRSTTGTGLDGEYEYLCSVFLKLLKLNALTRTEVCISNLGVVRAVQDTEQLHVEVYLPGKRNPLSCMNDFDTAMDIDKAEARMKAMQDDEN